MFEVRPEQLRNDAERFRQLAARYEELASLLEETDLGRTGGAVDALLPKVQTHIVGSDDSGPLKRGEALRRVIVAAAKFGDSDFSASEIAAAVRQEVAEKTVYAVFQRRRNLFEEVRKDRANERISRYRLRGYTWVFTYGINMDRKHLMEAFSHLGFDYEKIVVDAFPATMPEARLSWRNESKKWGGGTATFDPAEDSELPGLAYLVTDPEGLKAFQAKERPNYVEEIRRIVIDGRGLSAHVFNVDNKLRHKQEMDPAISYLEQVISAAMRESLPAHHIQQLQRRMKT
ncbi:MAG TPA: hypothetical protein V6D08_20115 [Candidatus Obscuribacterales bacterium]